MNVKWTMSIGYQTDRTGEVELADDCTDAEIEEAIREDAFNFLELSWEKTQ